MIKKDLAKQQAEEIDRLRLELASAEAELVSVFYENGFPEFSQGAPTHELQYVATAATCNGLVELIESLTKQLEEANAALAKEGRR